MVLFIFDTMLPHTFNTTPRRYPHLLSSNTFVVVIHPCHQSKAHVLIIHIQLFLYQSQLLHIHRYPLQQIANGCCIVFAILHLRVSTLWHDTPTSKLRIVINIRGNSTSSALSIDINLSSIMINEPLSVVVYSNCVSFCLSSPQYVPLYCHVCQCVSYRWTIFKNRYV